MRAATQPALPAFLQLPIPTTLRESGSIVPEPEQRQTGSDAWETIEELATQSEPLATMETPAGEEPVVIVKEQSDHHVHPQMPEDEQQAVAEVSSDALPGTHQETTTEDMLAITVKQQTVPQQSCILMLRLQRQKRSRAQRMSRRLNRQQRDLRRSLRKRNKSRSLFSDETALPWVP